MFEVGGGGVFLRSCNAVVSAAESLCARSRAVLTVIVDGVGVELGVVEPTRLLEVLLCACAEVVVRYKVWGHRRCSIQLSQRQRGVHSRGHDGMSTIIRELESLQFSKNIVKSHHKVSRRSHVCRLCLLRSRPCGRLQVAVDAEGGGQSSLSCCRQPCASCAMLSKLDSALPSTI
jgi:hypothetical protein